MKHAYFQILWTAGIGELYMSVADVLNYGIKCKEKGYTCSLKVIIGPGNKYVQNINFFDIFDKSQFSFFDSFIQTSEVIFSENNLNIPPGLKHIFTGVNKVKEYAPHQWSLFSNINNIETDTNTRHFMPMRLYLEHAGVNPTYTILPLFASAIENRSKSYMSNFSNMAGVQFRVHDDNFVKETTSFYTKYERELTNIIKEYKNIYVTTNCSYLKEKLKPYSNVVFYEYAYPDIGKYHTYYHTHGLNLSYERQVANLMDLVTEMCNLKYVSPIFSFNENVWHSQFLGPALLNIKYGAYHYRLGPVPTT